MKNKDIPNWILKAQKASYKTASLLQAYGGTAALIAGSTVIAGAAIYGAATLLPDSVALAGISVGGEVARALAVSASAACLGGFVAITSSVKNQFRSEIASTRLDAKEDTQVLQDNVIKSVEAKQQQVSALAEANKDLPEPKESWARKAKNALTNTASFVASGLQTIGGSTAGISLAVLAVSSVALAAKVAGVDMGGQVAMEIATFSSVASFATAAIGGTLSGAGELLSHAVGLDTSSEKIAPEPGVPYEKTKSSFLSNLKSKIAEEEVAQSSLDLDHGNNPNLQVS